MLFVSFDLLHVLYEVHDCYLVYTNPSMTAVVVGTASEFHSKQTNPNKLLSCCLFMQSVPVD